MKIKSIILSAILSCTMILSSVQFAFAEEPTSTPDKWPLGPEINAGSAILIDADTGTILYEKNAHEKAYPASTTKLMTTLLALENCTLTETVTFSYDAVHSISPGDAYIATKEGEQYTMEQCLYALLLPSANEVAYGIAEHVSGSVESFVSLMNQRARELGAINTHFNNSSGLFDPNHYTTAYDLARIGRACMSNTTMLSMMQTRSYEIPPTNKTKDTRYLNQRHALLRPGTYYYEYCVGGKTGFTDESQYTLISFASKGDLNLICVTFQCELEEYRYLDTTALFNWGFDNFEKVTVSSEDAGVLLKNTDYYKTRIFGSPQTAFSLETSYITLPNNTNTSKVTTSISRENVNNAFAVVTFHYNNRNVGTANLVVVKNSEDSDLPSNLPFLSPETRPSIASTKYVVLNAWAIIYVSIAILLLLVFLFVALFINLSPQGKEMMKTRRRRKGYGPHNKLHF